MGFRGKVSRFTLADTNESHAWRLDAGLAHLLIGIARPMNASEDPGLELDNTVYTLDSTMIDLCSSMFPLASHTRTASAIKMHTLLDVRGAIPTLIAVSSAKQSDVTALDWTVPEPGSRLPRFRAPSHSAFSRRILRDSSQV